MTTLLLAIFLTGAMVYGIGGWLYAFAMYVKNDLPASVELDDHMFKLGLCAILAAGFLYLGDKL